MNDKNAYEDETHSGRRMKPRGKRRKSYVIETRYLPPPERRIPFFDCRGMYDWHTYHRYETESRRNQAYAALVKKAQNGWGTAQEFRMV